MRFLLLTFLCAAQRKVSRPRGRNPESLNTPQRRPGHQKTNNLASPVSTHCQSLCLHPYPETAQALRPHKNILPLIIEIVGQKLQLMRQLLRLALRLVHLHHFAEQRAQRQQSVEPLRLGSLQIGLQRRFCPCMNTHDHLLRFATGWRGRQQQP
ncbi:hypothetical protein PSEUDO8Z_10550 [Pseudomonas sp. 8Z]|nr:hypothetical protein PSEUDO8Z_10550 [Pseudomonas sp. 8Z]